MSIVANAIGLITNNRFLSSCGVSAVQADGFYMLESLSSAAVRRSVSEPYLHAQSTAAINNFVCGSMTSSSLSPAALLSNLRLIQSGHQQVVRNSAVFEDHRRHIFVNASNAHLSKCIGNIPDWGSVNSTRENAALELAARCISGGPIEVSSFDGAGADDRDVVKRITTQTLKGKTVTIRPTGVGTAIDPYVAFEDETLLAIANTHGKFMPFNIKCCPVPSS